MNYYYLLTSLPPITLEDPLPKIDIDETLEFIQRNLQEQDLKLSKYLFYSNDNYNFTDLILEQHHGIAATYFKQPSNFQLDELKLFLKNGTDFPDYIAKYLFNYGDKFDLLRPTRITEYLWMEFYNELDHLTNDFIKAYFKFDKLLRQLVAVHNMSLFKETVITDLVNDAVIRELGLSKPESVLSQTYPFVTRLWNALSEQDPITIEKTMDSIRWDFIDDYNMFSFFSIDQVFGYMLKLKHLSRWLSLNREKGKERCINLCNEAIEASGILELEKL